MYVRTSSGLSGLGGFGLGDALVSSLAASIRQVEGVNPNFAANNNPGNLIYVGQSGAVPGAGGFAAFPSAAAGEAALESQIQNYINRGYNLTQFFNTYAPSGTVNGAGAPQTSAATQAYINTVSSNLGLDPSVPLNSVQSSFTGPGSVASSSPSDFSGSSSSSPADLSASGLDLASYLPSSVSDLIPGSDTQIAVGGLVLSESDLIILGLATVGTLLVFSIL